MYPSSCGNTGGDKVPKYEAIFKSLWKMELKHVEFGQNAEFDT